MNKADFLALIDRELPDDADVKQLSAMAGEAIDPEVVDGDTLSLFTKFDPEDLDSDEAEFLGLNEENFGTTFFLNVI